MTNHKFLFHTIGHHQREISFLVRYRIFRGGVDNEAEEYDKTIPVSAMKSPQKARILLMLSLMKTNNPDIIQGYFGQF
jgi:L-asparaginase/Glu-tRNA(Gln) amidotransferase subunit D